MGNWTPVYHLTVGGDTYSHPRSNMIDMESLIGPVGMRSEINIFRNAPPILSNKIIHSNSKLKVFDIPTVQKKLAVLFARCVFSNHISSGPISNSVFIILLLGVWYISPPPIKWLNGFQIPTPDNFYDQLLKLLVSQIRFVIHWSEFKMYVQQKLYDIYCSKPYEAKENPRSCKGGVDAHARIGELLAG